MLLLRSSSTPILSSMLEHLGNSVNSLSRTSSIPGNYAKPKIPQQATQSPVTRQSKHIRRVSSESNLKAISSMEEESENDSPVKFNNVSTKRRWNINKFKSKAKLEPIPSFSLLEKEMNDEKEDDLGIEFSFPQMMMDTKEDNRGLGLFQFSDRLDGLHLDSRSLYMAVGLGIDPDLTIIKHNEYQNGDQITQHYEKMVKDNPCNPLVLRNYARHLYKIEKDYTRAEELYSRAILAEPNDGGVLSEYARLRWEIHGEEETASVYFESAVLASPKNSDVLAAYASFLWNTEDKQQVEDTVEKRQLCYATY
ncbi:hypothetical protein GIB67_024308 [Kingdonia uniflora]|uniref:TmcB/TmcC TPR repeats domain-containing protein n=1 Tax=Kingdonia uniflora TaxID=39325 RepID=A0A7J7LFD2_9MAGN|nr:hypothetical protein GIB67_024308 [Kingdonia uniflora]